VGLAVGAHRRPADAGRQDLTAVKPSPRRLVLEGLVVVLAVAGTVALRRRGLTNATGGTDPFIAAVPVLLATAAGLIALRAYPYPLHVIGRIAARGRSAVVLVGFAQATRQSLTAALPLLILLLATAITGFAAAVDVAVGRAQESSAWRSVGADARVSGSAMDDGAVARVEEVEGVAAAVPAVFADGAELTAREAEPRRLSVIAVDLDAYRRVVTGRPLHVPPGPSPAGAETPALLSPGLAAGAGRGVMSLSWPGGTALRLRSAGTIDGFPTQPGGTDFVVVPYTALARAGGQANTIFVRGHGSPAPLDPARLRRAAVPHATEESVVTADTYARAHGELTRAPLVGLVRGAFRSTALGLGGYGALAVLLALVLGAEVRRRTVSYLSPLGLGAGQARRLTLVELAPGILSAAVTGWVVGLLLPRVIGPAMDLRAYTGGFPASDHALDLRWTMLSACGFTLFTGLALAVNAGLDARRDLGGASRTGDRP
jgi:putative ABC transport system permease protein